MPAGEKNESQYLLIKTHPMRATTQNLSQHKLTTMPARTQNVSQHVLTKPLPCQRGHKIYLDVCWQNPFLASKDTKCISTCVDQTLSMQATTQNASPPMPARKRNVTLNVLTKLLSCQQGHEIYLKLWWLNLSHMRDDIKCISTCVEKTPPITKRTQIVSLHVLTKHFPCQRGQKMYFNSCWRNPSHVSEDTNYISTLVEKNIASEETKYISTCVDQTHSMSTRTQNANQHKLTKLTKSISIYVYQTHPMLARK